MASTPEGLNQKQRDELYNLKKFWLSKKIKWDTKAVQVIKEKIKHYKKTGNKRKLAIYESKLKGTRNTFSKLESLKKVFDF